MEEIIEIVCIEDFPKFFQEYWSEFNPEIHKKGWETWVCKDDWNYDSNIYSSDGLGSIKRLLPEYNKYSINFPKSHFKIKES